MPNRAFTAKAGQSHDDRGHRLLQRILYVGIAGPEDGPRGAEQGRAKLDQQGALRLTVTRGRELGRRTQRIGMIRPGRGISRAKTEQPQHVPGL